MLRARARSLSGQLTFPFSVDFRPRAHRAKSQRSSPYLESKAAWNLRHHIDAFGFLPPVTDRLSAAPSAIYKVVSRQRETNEPVKPWNIIGIRTVPYLYQAPFAGTGDIREPLVPLIPSPHTGRIRGTLEADNCVAVNNVSVLKRSAAIFLFFVSVCPSLFIERKF